MHNFKSIKSFYLNLVNHKFEKVKLSEEYKTSLMVLFYMLQTIYLIRQCFPTVGTVCCFLALFTPLCTCLMCLVTFAWVLKDFEQIEQWTFSNECSFWWRRSDRLWANSFSYPLKLHYTETTYVYRYDSSSSVPLRLRRSNSFSLPEPTSSSGSQQFGDFGYQRLHISR